MENNIRERAMNLLMENARGNGIVRKEARNIKASGVVKKQARNIRASGVVNYERPEINNNGVSYYQHRDIDGSGMLGGDFLSVLNEELGKFTPILTLMGLGQNMQGGNAFDSFMNDYVAPIARKIVPFYAPTEDFVKQTFYGNGKTKKQSKTGKRPLTKRQMLMSKLMKGGNMNMASASRYIKENDLL